MLTRRKPEREPRPDRSAEFASFEVARARSVMVTRLDLVPEKKAVPAPLANRKQGRKPATTAEREHMGRVAALGCVVCRLMGFGPTPAQVHHTREGQGGAQRAGNYLTLPLCLDHHTGPTGVHGDKSCLRQLKVTELDLLDLTISQVITATTKPERHP